MRTEIALRELAHGRTGDKGDRLNISVIAKRPEDFQHLVQTVTDDHVARVFAHLGAITVTRYLLPKIAAMNFVLDKRPKRNENDRTQKRPAQGLHVFLYRER